MSTRSNSVVVDCSHPELGLYLDNLSYSVSLMKNVLEVA